MDELTNMKEKKKRRMSEEGLGIDRCNSVRGRTCVSAP